MPGELRVRKTPTTIIKNAKPIKDFLMPRPRLGSRLLFIASSILSLGVEGNVPVSA
jgi:hypothetical protein